jgi:ATP-dependent RNA helicase RhlE
MNPDFKGGFHEKKAIPKANPNKVEKKRGNKNSKAKRNRNQMKTQAKWKK